MDLKINERGNNAFHNDNGCAILIAQLGDQEYLQASYTPTNYPTWHIETIIITETKLTNHIMYNLCGWKVDKCQLNINIDDNEVADIDYIKDKIMEYVIEHHSKYENIRRSINTAAVELNFIVTDKIVGDCITVLKTLLIGDKLS